MRVGGSPEHEREELAMDEDAIRKASVLTRAERALVVKMLETLQDAEPRPIVLVYTAAHLLGVSVFASEGKLSMTSVINLARGMARDTLRNLRS